MDNNQPDVTNENPAYWEHVLAGYGLSMNAGRYSNKKVSLIGGLNNLVGIEKEQYRKDSGQVIPMGRGPES